MGGSAQDVSTLTVRHGTDLRGPDGQALPSGAVLASGNGTIAAGGHVINPRTEVHYHLHPTGTAVPGSGDVAPAIVFESQPVYPHLEFSIVNRGPRPVQITAIRVLRAASIKAALRGNGLDHLQGPRLKLDFDLRTARQGTWTAAFSGRVSNLAPHEAEAFVLDLSTVNTLNLVDIEFEYISSATPHVLTARPSDIVYVDSPLPGHRYPGSVQPISRTKAFSRLLQEAPTPIHGPALDFYPEDANLLLARGAAHLCHDRIPDGWRDVMRRLGGSSSLGPAVASFAEFGQAHGLPDSVRFGLEAWLGDPAAIRRAPIWDNESHADIVRKFLVPPFPPQLGSRCPTIGPGPALCFNLLDSTLTLDPEGGLDGDDFFEDMRFIMAQATLSMTRKALLQQLVDCYGPAMIEYLVVNIRLSAISEANYESVLETVLGGDAPPALRPPGADGIQERWLTWWEEQRDAQATPELEWRPFSPRLATAARALFARTPDDVPEETDELVMLALARNPRVVDHFAPDLAHASEVQVRQEVAMNRHASPETLKIFARDPSAAVRRWVASNPNTDETTLAALREDDQEDRDAPPGPPDHRP